MSYNFSTIRFWREDDIGIIVPSDEQKELNSLMISEMIALLLSTSEDKEVNHIVITNEGTKTFIKSPAEFSECNIKSYVKLIRSLVIIIKTIEKSIIFAVNGNTSDISAELSFTGDFLVVRSNITFSLQKLEKGMPLIVTSPTDYLKNNVMKSLFFGDIVTGYQLYSGGIAHFLASEESYYDDVKRFIKKIPKIYNVNKIVNARNVHQFYSDPYLEEKIVESLKNYHAL